MRWIASPARLMSVMLLLCVLPGLVEAQQRAQPRFAASVSTRWADVSRTHVVALADSAPQDSTPAKPRRQYFKHTVLGAGIGAGVGIVLMRVFWNALSDYSGSPDTEAYVVSAVLFGAVGAVIGSLAP